MIKRIIDFDDPILYLKEVKTFGKSDNGKGRSFSGAQWALRLGYRSKRTIGMVLSGRRFPSHNMLEKISYYLGHSPLEHRYFELLFQLKKKMAKDDFEKKKAELLEIKAVLKGERVTLRSFTIEKSKLTDLLIEKISSEVKKYVKSGTETDTFIITVQRS